MFRDVVLAITGTTFQSACGLLHGFAQFRMKEDGQAAMIPFPDRAVDGVIYRDVDSPSLARLDAFQGKGFERIEVTIEAENGEWIEADAYCLKLTRTKVLMADEWDEDDYRSKYLKKVLASCRTSLK
jgi:hypothetical protein